MKNEHLVVGSQNAAESLLLKELRVVHYEEHGFVPSLRDLVYAGPPFG